MAKSPPARHRRRTKLFTPRRWLPFVALVVLVVAAVAIEPNEASDTPEPIDPTLDVATLPAVTSGDDISTAWYCGGATAVGGDGTAELTVVIANDDVVGGVAEVTLFGEAGELTTETVDVPAHGRARVVAAELAEADWVAALVEVRGGRVAVDQQVSGPLGFDSAPCSTQASDHWYVPSGSTLRGAEEYLSLFNPFPDSASVDVAFATNTGPRTPRSLRGFTVPGRSVRVVKVSDTVTDRSAIAATVQARAGRLIVNRVQTYDGTGDPLGSEDAADSAPPEGLVSTSASPVRAPRWVFPAARVSPGVRNQIAVYNPSGKVAEVDVVINPQSPDINIPPEPVQLSIRPHEQEIVDLTDVAGLRRNVDLWIDVRSLDGVPVVAERLAFFTAPSERTGAVVSAGTPFAATQWMVTQGGASRSVATSVPIANPGPRDARITVYQLSGGTRVEVPSAAVTVPKGDRLALVLDEVDPAATLVIASSEPVVVASSMAELDGQGIAAQPGFGYPEAVVALPPVR